MSFLTQIRIYLIGYTNTPLNLMQTMFLCADFWVKCFLGAKKYSKKPMCFPVVKKYGV